MTRRSYKMIFRLPSRLLTAGVLLLTAPGLTGIRANPVGEVVQSGSATFDRGPNQLTVTTSHQVVIGWQDFSIGNGETTRFVQPSIDSLAINRVMSGNPSQLFGTLQANGRIALINPNGILVGGGAVIDTGSFLASTLEADPEQMLRSHTWSFQGDSTAVLENQGTIIARSGDLILISKEVRNSGTLTAAEGTVALGGGREVLVSWAQDAGRRLFVRPAGLDGAVENRGAIEAAQVELEASGGNPYALAVNNEGTIRATGSVHQAGRVYLVAKEGALGNSGSIYARNADGSGGTVRIKGKTVELTGTVDASAASASDVAGKKGGSIRVEGDNILLRSGTVITADGPAGGGRIEIGGGLRGQDPDISLADNVTAESGVVLSARALDAGDGGTVVVWSRGTTSFQGAISARGGDRGGKGGFVEVSGLQSWFFPNWLKGVDVAAPAGAAGTFLIDPNDITIVAGNGTAIGASPTNANTLFADSINTFLAGANLVIQTNGTGGTGNITVQSGAALSWAGAQSLTLIADAAITFESGTSVNAPAGTLNLQFAQTVSGTLTFASVLPTATSVTITAGNGGGITATLRGPDANTTYTITGNTAGTLAEGGRSASFSNIDILNGGSGDDTFVFSGNNAFAGSINGGGQVVGDRFDFSTASGFTNNTDVGTLDPDGRVGSESNIEIVIAPNMGTQRLRGNDTAGNSQAWSIASNGVTANSVIYQGYEELTGRDADDTFTFAGNATFAGDILGGNGTNAIVLTGAGQSVVLTGTQAGGVNGAGTFVDIDSINGGTGGTLTGPNAATTWTVSGVNSGTVLSVAFANFANLTGGSANDTFTFTTAGTLSGMLAGGGGTTDTINLSTDVDVVTITGTGAGSVVDGSAVNVINSFTGIESIDGGATGANTLVNNTNANVIFNITANNGGTLTTTVPATLIAFSSFGNLTGDDGFADQFVFGNGRTLSGAIDGGTGADVLDFSASTTAVTVNLTTGTSTNIAGGISGLETVIGGTVGDTLTASTTFSSTLQGGGGNDTYNVTFAGAAITTTITEVGGGGVSDTVNLTGTAGADTFTLTAATTLSDGSHSVAYGANVEDVNLDGLGGSDTLVAFNQVNTFNITAANIGDLGVIDFSNIENLTGGSDDDTFTFTGAGTLSGTLTGGGGTTDTINLSTDVDVVTITAAGAGSVVDGSAANVINSFTGIESIDGGATGANTLVNNTDADGIFNVTANNGGTLTTTVPATLITFSNMGNLTGDDGFADQFVFSDGVSLSGNLNGGTGTDVLDFSASTTAVTVNLATGASTNITGGISGIETVIGTSEADTLTASSTFSSTLEGGGGNDTYNVTFGGVSITTTITEIAGGGSDTVNLTGTTGVDTFTLTAATTLSDGSHSVAYGANVEDVNLDGLAGSDSLVAFNQANTFNITGANAGDLNVVDFNNIENLTGGSDDDIFSFGVAGTLSGTLSGGGGTTNTINLSTDVDVVTITGTGAGSVVDGSAANVINGFTGIESIDGGATGANTLVNNTDADAIFNITSNNGGTLTTTAPVTLVAFSSFGNLTGDDGFADQFVFSDGVSLSGNVNGGTGTDVLDFSASATAVTVNLATGASTNITGGISGIETVIGTSEADTLTASSTFSSTLEGGGGNDTYNVTFGGVSITTTITEIGGGGSDIVNLTGTTGADTFTLTAATTLSDGSHSVAYGANVEDVNLDGLAGSDTLVAFSQVNTFNVTGSNEGDLDVIDFISMENLTGGSANDTFTFTGAGTLSGTLTGGGGTTDAINLSTDVDVVTITGTGAGSVVDGSAANVINSFTGIESIDGGATGANTLVNNTNAAAIFNITSNNGGTLTTTAPATLVAFSSFGNLTGDDGIADRFVFSDGVSLSGNVNGGTGTDVLDFSASATAVTVNLATGASTNITGGISGIETVIGTSEADTLTASSTFSSTLEGGGGNDTYNVTFGGVSITTTITEIGGGGSDTVNLTGTTGVDTFTLTAATTLSDGSHSVAYGANVEDVNLDGLAGSDTLVAFNQVNTFNVTGSNEGGLDVIDFISMENLTGGSANDTFTFTGAGTLSGTLTGGGGTTDAINLSTDVDVVTITGTGAGSVVDGSAANVINSFTGIESIDGGATGANTLTGPNAVTAWTISGVNSGTVLSVAFANFANLTGGSANDTFTFTTAGTLSGMLAGGGGTTDTINLSTDVDVVTITGTGAGSVVDGSTVNVINGFTGIESIDGGATGANTLVNNTDADAIFNITANNGGTLTTTVPATLIAFSSFGNLTGDDGFADQFVFGNGRTLSGAIDGGTGADVLDFSASTTAVTVNLTTGTSTNIAGGISGLETVIGGTVGDTLTASTTFSSTLQGGGGNDTYNVTFAGAAITTTITEVGGGGVSDTVNLTGTAGADTFTLTAATTLSDGSHAVAYGANVEDVNLDGLASSDSLVAFNQANTFNITGANAGDLNVVDFNNIENLTGGSDDDIFSFGAAGTLSGTLSGGGGTTNTINLSTDVDVVTITGTGAGSVVDGSAANVINSFTGIESIAGGATGANTLTGPNAATSWTVSGANSGTVLSVAFANFSNLTGGSANDTFTFTTAGTLSGTLAGGGGATDTINLSTDVDVVTITGTGAGSVVDGSAANVINSFTGIESIDGGATGANTLVNNTNAAAIFNITANNGGTLTTTVPATLITFANMGNLTGDDGVADQFVFGNGRTLSGAINGGTGTDVLDFSASASAVTVNLATGASTNISGGISGIETVIGGAVGDTLTASSTFSSTLQGGGGNDTYNVTFGGAAITTTITEVGGGGVTDTVNLTGTAGADTFTLTAATTLSDGSHAVAYGANVEDVNLDGGGDSDTLVAFNQTNTFNVTAADTGDLGVIDFSNIANLTGGTGADTFVFAVTGSLTGDLRGGNGADVFDFSAGGSVDGAVEDTSGSSELIGTLTAGSITLAAVALGSDVILDTSAGNGTVEVGAVTGNNRQLQVTSGSGSKTFNGAVSGLDGGTRAALVLEGSGTTEFTSTVSTVAGGIDASSAGQVVFKNSVTLGDGVVASSFGGLVQFDGSSTITFSGYDGLTFSGGIEVMNADLVIDSQDSNLDLAGLDGGGRSVTLTVGAGTVDLLGQDMIDLDNLTLTAALARLASVTGAGTQTYEGQLLVSGTLSANRLEFTGSGDVTADDGSSPALTSASEIYLNKTAPDTVRLSNDSTVDLSSNATLTTLEVLVTLGNLNVTSSLQASSLLGLSVDAGDLTLSTGTLTAPLINLTVSGNSGTSPNPIRTNTSTTLALDLGGNAFLVEQSRKVLGTEITFSGGAAAQTIDLTLSGGDASLGSNFGDAGDYFIIRVTNGSFVGNASRFTADGLTIIATGAIGSSAANLLTAAETLNLQSGGSGGTYVSEQDSVEFQGTAGSGAIQVIAADDLSVAGNVTTTGDVLLRSTGGDILGATTGSPTISANILNLDAPLGDIQFNNLALVLTQGFGTSGNEVILGNMTITNDLTITASGPVSQTGALQVGGRLTVSSPGESITLTNAANSFGSVSMTGSSLDLREANNTVIDLINVTGSAFITSGGSITQTGFITAASLALSATQFITLENLGNTVATLGNVVRGGAFKFYTLGNLDINGDMSLGSLANQILIRAQGDIDLLPGTQIATTGTVNDLVLASLNGNITDNSLSATSLNPQGGSRFVLYSGTRVQTLTGLLTVNFVQLSSPYPSAPSQSGNALLVREGVPGDTTIVVIVPYTPPVTTVGLNVGDFGLRTIDVGSSGISGSFRNGRGVGGGLGLFSVDENGNAQEIGEDAAEAMRQLRRILQEDMSAAAKDEILQALADILSGRLDPREVRLPPGLVYQEDSHGNSVIIPPELAYDFLISILDTASYDKLMQALSALPKNP